MSVPIQLLWVVILACILWGAIGSSQVVHQPRYLPFVTPSDYGLLWKPLRLLTADKIPIACWLIRHPEPKGIILLLHGFGTCKADLLDLAQSFSVRGEYHLVLFDFRGHGESGGSTISFGKQEVQDIAAVLGFLSRDADLGKLPIGCLGISMGGSIGLVAAARFPEIQAVVSDSAYLDFSKAIARAIRMSYYIPRFPLGQIVIWATQLRLRSRLCSLSPGNIIGAVSPRPIMIIHGTHDKTTPFQEAEMLFHLAREPKRFWLVNEVEHVGAFFKEKEEYLQRVLEFFRDGLR